MISFGANLRAHREAVGLTLRQLARRIRRSPGWLSLVERDLATPGETTLRALLKALDNDALSDLWMARVGIVPDELAKLLLTRPERWHEVRVMLREPRVTRPPLATLTYPVDADGRDVEL